jgi:hypothetical protein
VWHETKQVVPLSTNGSQTILHGLTLGSDPTEPRDVDLPPGARKVALNFFEERSRLTDTGAIVRFGLEETADEPLGVGELFLAKMAQSWYATDSRTYDSSILLLQIVYGMLAITGLWLCARRKVLRAGHWLVLAVVGYFWLTDIAVLSIVRYLLPAIGLLMGFCALPLAGTRRVSEVLKQEKRI